MPLPASLVAVDYQLMTVARMLRIDAAGMNEPRLTMTGVPGQVRIFALHLPPRSSSWNIPRRCQAGSARRQGSKPD